ncbi:HAD family phosphatase [Glaciihabitans sp. UYNi722]|uniref:HAD family hydrolase n=1 Tax=Glaciihabitans sp. UYNi722 TaxID=3156344 RepID=UPI003393736E
MPLTISDRVVVFDYGEVISRSPSERARADLLEVAGVDAEAFWASYWAHRHGLDEGTTSIREYWKLVAADVEVQWPESKIHELWVADFTGWLSVEPGTFDVLADLHEGGTRIALLSNAGFDFASPFRFSPMAQYFERMFISAEMSKLKPNADIYLEVASELGISPARMIFIDNKQENVDGAEALGIIGHLFVGHRQLRSFLESLTDR